MALCEDPEEVARLLSMIADIRSVLVQMLCPPVLRTGEAGNAVLALEHTFLNQVAELETHCGVRDAPHLSMHDFFHRVDYFEAMMRAKQAVQ